MMQLYSGTTCAFSHRCRFVLYEKGMDFQVIDVDMYNKPEDIAVMNPYNRLPVLVERDLILYESNIINEYIDERFPHPQLMPADPVMRAHARLMLFNMEVELFGRVEALESGKEKREERAPARHRSPDRARAGLHQDQAHARRRLHHARCRDRAAALAPRPLRHQARQARRAVDEV